MEVTMKGIKKSFGENQVLRGVDFNVIAGEIHALMGENGAGKSTLMNILTGLLQADEGSIWVDNQEVKYDNPNDAEDNGISFIHQEMNVWPDMTVLENLFMGKEITNKFGFLDNKKMTQQANEVFAELNVQVDLNEEVGRLSVGQQQMI